MPNSAAAEVCKFAKPPLAELAESARAEPGNLRAQALRRSSTVVTGVVGVGLAVDPADRELLRERLERRLVLAHLLDEGGERGGAEGALQRARLDFARRAAAERDDLRPVGLGQLFAERDRWVARSTLAAAAANGGRRALLDGAAVLGARGARW